MPAFDPRIPRKQQFHRSFLKKSKFKNRIQSEFTKTHHQIRNLMKFLFRKRMKKQTKEDILRVESHQDIQKYAHNRDVKVVDINETLYDPQKPQRNLTDQGCLWIIQGNWPKLIQLTLHNQITDDGCQILIRGNWPLLKIVNLDANQITNRGCQFIMKSHWPILQQMRLDYNQINTQGCEYLVKAHWPKLRYLRLDQNQFEFIPAMIFMKSNWPDLQEIILSSAFSNQISSESSENKGDISKQRLRRKFSQAFEVKL